MANTSSAQKAHRVSLRRAVINARRKRAMKDSVKGMAQLISGKKGSEGIAMLPSLYQAIDKAAKRGTIKKNTASRMKSRITKRLGSVSK